MASRLSTTLSGIAGEYFVAAELSRRGYVASLTLRNTRGIDILVSTPDASRSVGIQVKTKQGRGAEWVLTDKVERLADNLVFVFVVLNDDQPPDYYIVPRRDVAKYARDNHQRWLDTTGREGRAHVDTPMRKFRDPDGKYRGRWDLLGLGSAVWPAATALLESPRRNRAKLSSQLRHLPRG
jgi:hypothetical protein